MMNDSNPASPKSTASLRPERVIDDSPGRVLQLITAGQARTRSEIARSLDLSRSTVGHRLGLLFEAGLIRESDEIVSSGGRPSRVLELNPTAGLIVSIYVGEDRTRTALVDLEANTISRRTDHLTVSDGPEQILDAITAGARQLIDESDIGAVPILGLGLGLPAPVDYEAGRVRGWSVMTGWDDFDIRGHLQKDWPVPILLDNDVNLLTLAEHRRHWPAKQHLFYIKAGVGVGSGMVIHGAVDRGAQGAAGDIGHAHMPGFGDPLCRCGNLGCLESLVGGWALARDLSQEHQVDSYKASDVVDLINRGDSAALAKLRAAGRILGEAAAYATSLLNPDVVVIGGMLGDTGDLMLAGVRELIYQRALPLATTHLQIVPTQFTTGAGIAGAAYLVRDHLLDPPTLDRILTTGQSPLTARS